MLRWHTVSTTKPRAIEWLEAETGQVVPYTPERPRPRERHLSVRVSAATLAGLEEIAAERNVTVSQLVRDLVNDLVEQRTTLATLDARDLVERLTADLAEVRRRLEV